MNITTNNQSGPIACLIAAGILALAFAAGTANAQSAGQPDPLTKRVSYGDVNLQTAAGAQVFYARLRRAAEQVCAPLEPRDAGHKYLWQTCYDNALSSAVARVNSIALTTLHNQTGHAARSRKG